MDYFVCYRVAVERSAFGFAGEGVLGLVACARGSAAQEEWAGTAAAATTWIGDHMETFRDSRGRDTWECAAPPNLGMKKARVTGLRIGW